VRIVKCRITMTGSGIEHELVFEWSFFIVFVCLVGFFVYLAVHPQNRLRRGLDAFLASEPIQNLKRAFAACFWVLIAVGCLDGYFTKSGWYPRMREVPVTFKAYTWVAGELKSCYSASSPEKGELALLVCDSNTEETHSMNVKFWGTITTERDKIWKCEREETSLTCKLQ